MKLTTALVSLIRVAELITGAITSANIEKWPIRQTHISTEVKQSHVLTLLSVKCLVEDLNRCLANGSSYSDLIWSKGTYRMTCV